MHLRRFCLELGIQDIHFMRCVEKKKRERGLGDGEPGEVEVSRKA